MIVKFSINRRNYESVCNLLAATVLSHCAKVQKYNKAKKVSNFLVCGAKNVVGHYGERVEILNEHPFEDWPDRAQPSQPFRQKSAELAMPVRSALKGHPCRTLFLSVSLSIIFYYIISTTYKNVDLFCPVHIFGLSHSMSWNYCFILKALRKELTI